MIPGTKRTYPSSNGWSGMSERSVELGRIKIDVAGIVAAREAPRSWNMLRTQRTARISSLQEREMLRVRDARL